LERSLGLPALRDLSNPLLGGALVELVYIIVGLLVTLQVLYSLLTSPEGIDILGLTGGVLMAALGVDRLTAKRRFAQRTIGQQPNEPNPRG
jgi:hypothetical protein